MKMKFWSTALFIIFCSSSCQKTNICDKRQHLTLNIRFDPQTLDPRKVRCLCDTIITKNLFEGLTRIGSNNRPILALASAIKISHDEKTYTFFLRPSTWSNKEPLTAHDFVYAWQSALNPKFRAGYAELLFCIKNAKSIHSGDQRPDTLGAKVIDDQTLVVELENPTPYFLQLLANPTYFPIYSKVDQTNPSWSQQASTYISNGPFKLSKWKHGNVLSLTRNTNYWDKSEVKLNTIDMIMVTEETALCLFESGKLDWIGSPLSMLSTDSIETLQNHYQLLSKPYMGTNLIRINTQLTPFTSKNTRKAFGLAIDRAALVNYVLHGGATPTTALVPRSLELKSSSYFLDADVQMARQMIGSKNIPPVTLIYTAYERNHKIAKALQHQWKSAFGVNVLLEGLERSVYYERISTHNYELALSSWFADFADPINFLNVFKAKTNGTNNTHWENTSYVTYLNESTLADNSQTRLTLLAKAEALILEEMPIIPLYTYSMRYVVHPKLKKYILTPMGAVDFKNAYFLD